MIRLYTQENHVVEAIGGDGAFTPLWCASYGGVVYDMGAVKVKASTILAKRGNKDFGVGFVLGKDFVWKPVVFHFPEENEDKDDMVRVVLERMVQLLDGA